MQIELKMKDRQRTLMSGLVASETFADPVLVDCSKSQSVCVRGGRVVFQWEGHHP